MSGRDTGNSNFFIEQAKQYPSNLTSVNWINPRRKLQKEDNINKLNRSTSINTSKGFLDATLQKLNDYKSTAHSFLFGDWKDIPCSCGGSHGVCQFGSEAGPKDIGLYHTWKNTHKHVPKCIVEPNIIKGYLKPHQPYRYYFKILWTLTNETLNVWTHLLPAFYFSYLLYSYNQTIDLFRAWPLLLLTLSTIGFSFCSAIAHLFHSRSSYHHCCWFLLDYFGIALYAFSSITAHFYASAELSYYNRIGLLNLPIFVVIGVIGFYCCCYSKICIDGTTYHRRWKILSNAFGYIYGMIPIWHRYITREAEDPAMYYHAMQLLFMFLSPPLYAADLPERLWPGTFDIIGHSHQLFHVSIAIGCYYDILAVHLDVQSKSWILLTQQANYPTLYHVCISFFVLIGLCALVALSFIKEFGRCYKEELDGLYGRIGTCCTTTSTAKSDFSENKKLQ